MEETLKEYKKAVKELKNLKWTPHHSVQHQRELHDSFFGVKRLFCNIDLEKSELKINERILTCDKLIPEILFNKKIILYFHDGFFISGSPLSARNLCSSLAHESGNVVLIPEYQLSPEHPFPAPLEDAYGIYKFLRGKGIASEDIIFAGSGSGANIALSLTANLKSHKIGLPGALILFSPWVDFSLSSESMKTLKKEDPLLSLEFLDMVAHLYTYQSNFKNALVSIIENDFNGYPPMLIQYGEKEILRDDAKLLAKKAEAANVNVKISEWKNMWHLFQATEQLTTQAQKAIFEAGSWIKDLFKPEEEVSK